jgi:hypothetical protein
MVRCADGIVRDESDQAPVGCLGARRLRGQASLRSSPNSADNWLTIGSGSGWIGVVTNGRKH